MLALIAILVVELIVAVALVVGIVVGVIAGMSGLAGNLSSSVREQAAAGDGRRAVLWLVVIPLVGGLLVSTTMLHNPHGFRYMFTTVLLALIFGTFASVTVSKSRTASGKKSSPKVLRPDGTPTTTSREIAEGE